LGDSENAIFYQIVGRGGSTVLYRACWQWETDEGTWESYRDATLIGNLENARREGRTEVHWVSESGRRYTIDPMNMRQTSDDTLRSRVIRRSERRPERIPYYADPYGLDLPSAFRITPPPENTSIDLSEIDDEHKCPAGHFLSISPPRFEVSCGICGTVDGGHGCAICQYMKCHTCYQPPQNIKDRMSVMNLSRPSNPLLPPAPNYDLDPFGNIPFLFEPPASSRRPTKTCMSCDNQFVPDSSMESSEIPICHDCMQINQIQGFL